ncbi:MAG: DoxX family membrane protein [Desulfobacterales bacterium]|nr:DoxX family membrane protein [Desulfobacterales bacterium]
MKQEEGFKKKSIWTWEAVLFHASRLFLGGILIYAGFEKIPAPGLFAKAVYEYQILPDVLINLTALVLPWLELALGILLIVGIWLPGAVLLSSLLLLTFSGILIFNMARGLNISCGCFSTEPSTDPISWWTVMRDTSFLVPAFYLLFANRAEKQGSE